MTNTWEGVYEDDTHMKKPVDDHIQKTLTFVQEHEVILRTIEETTRNAVAEAPDSHYRAIKTLTNTPERVLTQDLVDTEHDLLRKVLSVLIFLSETATIFPSLPMFWNLFEPISPQPIIPILNCIYLTNLLRVRRFLSNLRSDKNFFFIHLSHCALISFPENLKV